MLPNQPEMLFSFLNTQLRDRFASLDELCDELSIESEELREKCKKADMEYQSSSNRFIWKKRVGGITSD